MSLRKNALADELFNLRDNLRLKLQSEGQDVVIAKDEAILEMAKTKPSRLSDFLAIGGLDRNFLDAYAHLFLDAITKNKSNDIKSIRVSKQASKVLDRYKDRLSDISRTNPNLYLGRMEKNRSYDLYEEAKTSELLDFLALKTKSYKLETNESQFNNLTVLYRQVNKDYKDYGTYHLYLAYPYLEGMIKKESFPIKAPFCYFPIRLERKGKNYTLIYDNDKDIVINRDLVLKFSKQEKSLLEVIPENLKDLSIKTLKEVVLPFFDNLSLNMKPSDLSKLIPFHSQLKDDFIKAKPSNFTIKPYLTFGRYQLYSSNIQKDMADIIESNTYNELLEGLINEENLFNENKPLNINMTLTDVNEANITYINDINFSQEKVIELVDKEKRLVIWGPPGTGKSQTITSLIANQVLKGENVLVVSEKKVALDVIYHRLAEARHFAMFIDDASNKNKFYQSLNKLINQPAPSRLHNNDIHQLEEEIKELDITFNQALNLLYRTNIEYQPLYTFYERYLKDKEIIEEVKPKAVYRLLKNRLSWLNFKEIENLAKTFDKDKNFKTFLDYLMLLNTYPWISRIKTKISRSSLLEFASLSLEIIELREKLDKSWFFTKKRLKNNFIKKHYSSLEYLSDKKQIQVKLLKTLIEDSLLFSYFQTELKGLNKTWSNYHKLSSKELEFLRVIAQEPLFKKLVNIEKYRNYIFSAYITGFLEEFKANNQKYLFILDNYEKKLNQLKTLINEKQSVAQESFAMKLYSHALDLSNTKRIMDIKRILEGDNSPSVKAFFEMFSIELFTNIKVWLLTPEAISAVLPLSFNQFDLVIFDEASQMYVEKGIPAIYRAKKVVIAGDPKQLRPSSLGVGRIDEDDLFEEDEVLKNVTYDAKSLLDLARYRYKEALLNYHYRSKYQELIEFSNHAFYDGKLIISPNVYTPKEPPISYIYVKDGEFRKRENYQEALAVINLLKKVLKDKEETESVGIITFNSTQRDLIMNLIDEELFKKSIHQKRLEQEIFRKEPQGDQSLFVKNIENVQGDERDIIIFSMGYAKDDSGVVKRRFGWLNHEGGQNRLNVAITRARKKIFFVSSLYPESLKVDDLSGVGPKLLKDFMRYCFYISNYNKELAKEVLQSLFKKESQTQKLVLSNLSQEIKNRLERLGYRVDEAIGIGQFNIDLAIFDEMHNQYVLGIICDLTNPNSFSARRELLHQEKFLNARGWKIMRIFHHNWYEDPNRVIKDIKASLKD